MVVGVWHPTTRFVCALACVAVPATAGAAVPAPASAAAAQARGVSVEIVDIPAEFEAGARPAVFTVVASRSSGRGCLKVRWSLVLKVEGISLEQVRLDRIEEDGSFPVTVRTEGSAARFTDERLDPGTLCRDRTVTAQYEINVTDDVGAGRLTLRPEAYDAGLRLLERDEATRSVLGAGGPPTTPSATNPPTAEATPAPGTGGGGPADPAAAPDRTDAAAAGSGLPVIWFAVGGLMVFLGLSLLLNVRRRQRRPRTAPVGYGPPDDWGFGVYDPRLANRRLGDRRTVRRYR